jgi:predicted dienelactone hydrolase
MLMKKLVINSSILLTLCMSHPSNARELMNVTRQDQRQVAMQVYQPDNKTCDATAIISHGAGGSENGYEYIAEFLSQHHYLVLVVGHKESGDAVLRPLIRKKGLIPALSELITIPSAYQARFMDINAARQWANQRCSTPFTVLIGHSMGAATVMLEAGAKNKLNIQGTDRFDAYVAMSPQGVGSIFPRNAWRKIHKPVLLLTGTKDHELNGSWTTRMDAFANMPTGCKWLGVIDGASHMNFADRGFSRTTEKLVTETTLAFLDGVRAKKCTLPNPSSGMSLQGK